MSRLAHLRPPTNCTTNDELLCARGNAVCYMKYGEAECDCLVGGQKFYKGTCLDPCGHDVKTFCPAGICYRAVCFPDVLSFILTFYSEHCRELILLFPIIFCCSESNNNMITEEKLTFMFR